MKELLKNLKEAERRADAADAAWEQDPENENLEKAFDEAYKAQGEAFNALATAIQRKTGLTKADAGNMIRMRREDLEALIENSEA